MDRILQEVHVAKSRLQLVALCCLLIAGAWPAGGCRSSLVSLVSRSPALRRRPPPACTAKYEEAEENVPSVTHLTDICSRSYSPASVHQMEIRVLDRLKWRITVVTPLHFLYYYLSKVCSQPCPRYTSYLSCLSLVASPSPPACLVLCCAV